MDSLAPVGPPAGQFCYSDSGYGLLGAIIERYADQPLGPAVMVFPDTGVTIAIAVTEQSERRMTNAVMGTVLAFFGATR